MSIPLFPKCAILMSWVLWGQFDFFMFNFHFLTLMVVVAVYLMKSGVWCISIYIDSLVDPMIQWKSAQSTTASCDLYQGLPLSIPRYNSIQRKLLSASLMEWLKRLGVIDSPVPPSHHQPMTEDDIRCDISTLCLEGSWGWAIVVFYHSFHSLTYINIGFPIKSTSI